MRNHDVGPLCLRACNYVAADILYEQIVGLRNIKGLIIFCRHFIYGHLKTCHIASLYPRSCSGQG